MPATRIATTSFRELQALGTGGQRAIDAADTLLALLRRELTAAHADLFAEPQVDSARGVIDWYAEGSGPAVPLATLSAESAAAVQAHLDTLTGDIRQLIERLRQSREESDRFLAEMFERALHVPDTDAVRVRGDAPVLVGWGHERIGAATGPVPLLGRVRAPATPMAILPPPVLPMRRAQRLLPYVLALAGALLLLGGAAWLYLRPRVRVASGSSCIVAPSDLDAIGAWRDVDRSNAALRAQLAAVTDDAGRRRLQCPPVQQATAPSPVQDAQRAEQRGAHAGRLQVILAWDDDNDLDLHVFCPDGTHVFFRNRTGCGGELDVDANAEAGDATETPVESMSWPNPPPGRYRVVVDPFAMRLGPRSPFRLTVRQEGQPDRVIQGVAEGGTREAAVTEIQVVPTGQAAAP